MQCIRYNQQNPNLHKREVKRKELLKIGICIAEQLSFDLGSFRKFSCI